MPRKAKTPVEPPRRDTFYDESKIEWRETAKDVFEAVNLAAPDHAMVAHAHTPSANPRWMFKASDGVLIERQYSEMGGTPIIVNAFNAQQMAIQWLNERHAEQKRLSAIYAEQLAGTVTNTWGDIMSDSAMRQAVGFVGAYTEIGGNVTESHVDDNGAKVIDQFAVVEVSVNGSMAVVADPPVLAGVDVAVGATQQELDGVDELKKRFPRVVDPFTGKEIPADDVAAASVVPNPAALNEASLDDELDQVPPQPTKGRRRKQ